MGLYLGDKTVNKIYLGAKTVNKIYLGDTLVWPTQGVGSHVYTGEYLATDFSGGGDPMSLRKTLIRNGRSISIEVVSLSSYTLDENNYKVETRIPIYDCCKILDEEKGKIQFYQTVNDDVIDWELDNLGVIWTWEDNIYTAFSTSTGKPVQYQNVKSKLENNEYNTNKDGKKTTRKITLTVQRTNI